MPFMQTGDKGKSLATINFANPNEAREIDLPAPTPGHAYNGLYLIMDAVVTAAAGAAAIVITTAAQMIFIAVLSSDRNRSGSFGLSVRPDRTTHPQAEHQRPHCSNS